MADGDAPPSAHRERMSTGTSLSGELPGDLNGAYLCIGENRVHRVAIDAGHARYDNRFVRTPTSAVNIVRHGGRLLALAESGRPHVLDDRLDTAGPCTFDGVLPDGICAHPKVDPATGEMLVFRCRRTPPFLAWTAIGRDGTARPMTPVDGIEHPSIVHDMAITRRYVVLVVAPLYFGSPPSWQPERGTRIALVPRDGGPVRWCHDDAFWVSHTANAHDVDDPAAGNPVVLDYAESPFPGARSHVARAVLDPAAGTVARSVVDDLNVDFCRIDDRLLGRAHPVSAFAVATGAPPHAGCRDALAWHDTRTDAVVTWRPDGLAVGEPVFAPDASGHGWWLALTTRPATGASALVVIPAADPARGPVAEIRMPVRGPLQHGNWITN
jgi:carotenoid cleavage dioxygenase-like enzyme